MKNEDKNIKSETLQKRKTKKEKITEVKKKLEKAEKLAEERLNQLRYLQADFDNFRKKCDREKEQIIKLANEDLIRKLLVILDDFDNSIRLLANEDDKQGLLILKNKFFKILSNYGLKEIESMGKKFNPNFHEVLSREFSEKKDAEIIEEIQKGYELHSKVIRPSKVKVSKGLKK